MRVVDLPLVVGHVVEGVHGGFVVTKFIINFFHLFFVFLFLYLIIFVFFIYFVYFVYFVLFILHWSRNGRWVEFTNLLIDSLIKSVGFLQLLFIENHFIIEYSVLTITLFFVGFRVVIVI